MESTETCRNNPVPTIPFDERAVEIPLLELDFCLNLARMEMGHSENMRHAAAHVREFLSEGMLEFTSSDWIDRYNISHSAFNAIVRSLRTKNMITMIHGSKIKYRFTAQFVAPPMKEPVAQECPYSIATEHKETASKDGGCFSYGLGGRTAASWVIPLPMGAPRPGHGQRR